MNSTYDVLWKNVPNTLKNNELIEQYVETISEVFDEVRKEINDQRFTGDYAENDTADIILTASDYGVEFPRNLSDDIKRRFVRDANEIFSRLGTRNGLDWAVRTLGVSDFLIDEIWAPNPDYLRQGYFKDIGDSDVSRYTIDNQSHNRFYVGREVVKSNGTFFEGYPYSDINKNKKVSDIPIYGEKYENYTNIDFTDTVSKTPYVAVKIFDDDFGILIDQYTDPETGLTYTYTPSERKQIVGEMITYFIQGLQRSANTKIIVITDFFYYTEFLDIDTPLTFDVDWNVFPIVEPLLYSDSELNGSFNEESTLIVGESQPIGFQPYYSIGEYIAKKIGEGNNTRVIVGDTVSIGTQPYYIIGQFDKDTGIMDIDASIRFKDYSYYIHPPGSEKTPHMIFMDYECNVEITNNFGGYVMVIEKHRQTIFGSGWEEVGRITYQQTFNKTFGINHALRISYVYGKDITVDSTQITVDSTMDSTDYGEDETDYPSPVSITYAV